MIVGLLPGLGGSLADLARVGQLERVLAYDIKAYAEAFDEVRYFSYATESEERGLANPVVPGVTRDLTIDIICRDRRWPVWPYAAALPFVWRTDVRTCDVLRVLNFSGALPAVIAKRLYGAKLVLGYNYHYLDIARLHGKPAHVLWLRILRRLALNAADGVIVPSAALEREVLDAGYGGYRVTAPNGVDLERFRPTNTGVVAPIILSVGRDAPEKNLGVVRDAAAQVKGATLVEIRDQAYAAMPSAFRGAGVFVLLSHTEGCSKVLIEAMATGLPCVVSAAAAEAFPGAPLLIVEDHERPASVAAALRRALKDPAYGLAARAYVEQHHNIHRTLYQEIEFVKWVGRNA